jgi:ubiquinone/menaquinone biosynthesis C-methylase UbiE
MNDPTSQQPSTPAVWQQPESAGAWSRAAASYSHTGPAFFQYFGKELVDFAGIDAGARLLDVATGRGAVLFPAIEKVGQKGEVIGIDYSEGMVEATNAEIKRLEIENAHAKHMSAEQMQFDDNSFDMVFCSFAIFFFPRLDRALSEFRRVLKPGGKLVVSTWGKGDDRWKWLQEMQRQRARELMPQSNKAPATPVYDTQESLEEVLAEAGFTNIKLGKVDKEFFYASAEEWWDTQWSHGSRIFLERIPAEALEQMRAFAYEKMAGISQPQGIPIVMRALFASATVMKE